MKTLFLTIAITLMTSTALGQSTNINCSSSTGRFGDSITTFAMEKRLGGVVAEVALFDDALVGRIARELGIKETDLTQLTITEPVINNCLFRPVLSHYTDERLLWNVFHCDFSGQASATFSDSFGKVKASIIPDEGIARIVHTPNNTSDKQIARLRLTTTEGMSTVEIPFFGKACSIL